MGHSRKMRFKLIIFSFFSVFFWISNAQALDVVFLTHPPKVLKSWSPEALSKLAKRNGAISAQTLIFDDSAQSLDLNDRADIDLVTLYGKHGMARVPRFLIWRGLLKLTWNRKTQSLDSEGKIESLVPKRLLVPAKVFRVREIQKIELAHHSWVYPGTRLVIRTNPAASRGEKLFTQSCLACHSLSGFTPLTPAQLTDSALDAFNTKHHTYPELRLDARATRGLAAYREALAREKTVVPSAQ